MKQSRFNEEQIIAILPEQESGVTVTDTNGGRAKCLERQEAWCATIGAERTMQF